VRDCFAGISVSIDGAAAPAEVSASIAEALKFKCGDKVLA